MRLRGSPLPAGILVSTAPAVVIAYGQLKHWKHRTRSKDKKCAETLFTLQNSMLSFFRHGVHWQWKTTALKPPVQISLLIVLFYCFPLGNINNNNKELAWTPNIVIKFIVTYFDTKYDSKWL